MIPSPRTSELPPVRCGWPKIYLLECTEPNNPALHLRARARAGQDNTQNQVKSIEPPAETGLLTDPSNAGQINDLTSGIRRIRRRRPCCCSACSAPFQNDDVVTRQKLVKERAGLQGDIVSDIGRRHHFIIFIKTSMRQWRDNQTRYRRRP